MDTEGDNFFRNSWADPEKLQALRTSPSLITLFELKKMGAFVRNQDIKMLLSNSVDDGIEPLGYPVFATRLKPNKFIDVCINSKWEKVEFLRYEGEYIYFRRNSMSEPEEIYFHKYNVAPAGLYTEYKGSISTINTVRFPSNYHQLEGAYCIRFDNSSYITKLELVNVSFPYVELRICYSDGHNGGGWDFQTFHIADPRVEIEGVTSCQPYYNSPIAVSHRWLDNKHPDPSNLQFQGFMALCERLNFLDCQTFFIDYCAFPQSPRTLEEEIVFREELPTLNSYFKKSTVILTEGSEDYEKRAWCMFELFLSSLNNAIINQSDLENQLKSAFQLARYWVNLTSRNFNSMWNYGLRPGKTVSVRQFNQWARGSSGMNLANYQTESVKKAEIFGWFQKNDLKASNEEDIAMIVELLMELL